MLKVMNKANHIGKSMNAAEFRSKHKVSTIDPDPGNDKSGL